MPLVLIADAAKASVVLTSEAFKDKIAGTKVIIADTGKKCIEMAKSERPDIIVVDFDLPDADGPSLIRVLRKNFQGPILMTACPDDNVRKAVAEDLFIYDDSSDWIAKPISLELLNAKIESFLINNRRITKRFDVKFETSLKPKATAKTPTSSIVKGNCINMSMTGALVKLGIAQKKALKNGLKLTLDIPTSYLKQLDAQTKTTPKSTTAKTAKPVKGKPVKGKIVAQKSKKSPEPIKNAPLIPKTKIEAKVAWQKDNLAGLEFVNLTESQQAIIEKYLKDAFLVAS